MGRNNANAEHIVVEWNIPKPPLFFVELHHDGCSLIFAPIPIGALPIRPESRLLKHGIPFTKAETILQDTTLAGGIDHDICKNLT